MQFWRRCGDASPSIAGPQLAVGVITVALSSVCWLAPQSRIAMRSSNPGHGVSGVIPVLLLSRLA